MSAKELAGKITISRPTFGDGRELITIKITDKLSRKGFIEVHVSPHDFSMAVTGLSGVECAMFVDGLDIVGMKKVTEQRSCVCPLKNYARAELEAWLIENAKEDGWIVDPYLGSQGSRSASPCGGQVLRYSVYKYIKPSADEASQ
ncbi:hypothetical protein KLEP174_gp50 [Pseudomonas phage vB_PcuM_ KLEP17-4]|nr:hypothetical protein KLEP174_gp50 [Pseudomonas phage vB_PcuM_ KLEP17-4]